MPCVGETAKKDSILGERESISPRPTLSQTGVCSHVLCSCDLPSWLWAHWTGGFLSVQCGGHRQKMLLPASSLVIWSLPHQASPGGAAWLVLPTHLFTCAQRPTPTDRSLSSSWSVSLPGWHPAAPKQQQRLTSSEACPPRVHSWYFAVQGKFNSSLPVLENQVVLGHWHCLFIREV